MLCHVGGLSQSGGLEGGGVVGHGGGGEGDALHGELVAFLFEEGGGESGRFDRGRAGLGGRAARTTDLGGELSHLLVEAVVLCLHLGETLDEELVLLLHADLLGLELLHLESLALAGCLSGSAVPENPFYPPLLLLIICFGAFATTVSGGNLHVYFGHQAHTEEGDLFSGWGVLVPMTFFFLWVSSHHLRLLL